MMKKKMITLWLVAGALAAGAGEIITYPVPRELLYTRHNDDFTVRAGAPAVAGRMGRTVERPARGSGV
jgi:hypothetical protein